MSVNDDSLLRLRQHAAVHVSTHVGREIAGLLAIDRASSERLIEQWAIWLPVAELRPNLSPAPLMPATRIPVRQPQPVTTRLGLQTTGGHVDRVAYGDETRWLRPTPLL